MKPSTHGLTTTTNAHAMTSHSSTPALRGRYSCPQGTPIVTRPEGEAR